MVKVYSKKNCMQCKMTKRKLTQLGIQFEEHRIDEEPAALAHVKALGFQQVPVVETSDSSWSGFRPNRIEELA